MKKWILLLLMIGFYSLASAHEEKDGMNPAGTYQMWVSQDPVDPVWQGIYVMDTRTGETTVCRISGVPTGSKANQPLCRDFNLLR